MLLHYPIRNPSVPSRMVEFSHIRRPIEKRCWNRDHPILLENCKLNIFMKSDFSVVVGEQVFSPIYGDLCFLAPLEQHYGQVPADMDTDYYQLDIGLHAFDEVPGGERLLSFLTDRKANPKIFVRPSQSDAQEVLEVCVQAERAIAANQTARAYAEVIRCLALFERIYRGSTQPEPSVLSKNVARTVRYIEQNYSASITLRQLSDLCGVSESWLSRSFRAEMGDTIHNYLLECRLRNAVPLLSEHSVAQVGYLCGFSDSSHFISQFRRFFGCTPTEYRRQKKIAP